MAISVAAAVADVRQLTPRRLVDVSQASSTSTQHPDAE
jgi:hypothetical protein